MKKTTYISQSLFMLIFLSCSNINAQQMQPDLSMRTSLYFTGAKTDKIDLASDKYVVKDASMTLRKSQGTNCDDGGCTFNIGFIATRSGNTSGELSTYGQFSVANVGMVGNTVFFGSPDKMKQGVHALRLKMGTNKVTFTIDPYGKVAESDENNNSFSVTFNVVAGTIPPVIRVPPSIKN